MRLQVLALHAEDRSPSQRYRVEAFLPFLRAQGVEVDYASALTRAEADVFYGRGRLREKAGVALAALARRARSVAPLVGPRPDVVLVQREAFFLGGAWAERLSSWRAPVVFDFDDAIWLRTISEANRRFAFLKNVEKVPAIARLARTVVAGNEHLAAWARRHSGDVVVIPTCEIGRAHV